MFRATLAIERRNGEKLEGMLNIGSVTLTNGQRKRFGGRMKVIGSISDDGIQLEVTRIVTQPPYPPFNLPPENVGLMLMGTLQEDRIAGRAHANANSGPGRNSFWFALPKPATATNKATSTSQLASKPKSVAKTDPKPTDGTDRAAAERQPKPAPHPVLPADVLFTEAIDLYSGRTGLPTNIPRSRELLTKASQQGNPLARMWLARWHIAGRNGVTKDPKRGEELAQSAISDVKKQAEAEVPMAMYLLSQLYEEGICVPQDNQQSHHWLAKAARAGEVMAMRVYGEHLVESARFRSRRGRAGATPVSGEHVVDERQALKEGRKWLMRTAKAGDSSAMDAIGDMFAEGRSGSPDPAKAVRWYQAAAERGNDLAMYHMACSYLHGKGVAKDETQALAWFQRSAEAGYLKAMNNLGYMHENGLATPKNAEEAAKWYRRAAEAGDGAGMANLALAYRKGNGVKFNLTEAETWARKAVEAGEKAGEQVLANIQRRVQSSEELMQRLEGIGTRPAPDPGLGDPSFMDQGGQADDGYAAGAWAEYDAQEAAWRAASRFAAEKAGVSGALGMFPGQLDAGSPPTPPQFPRP